jgi:hypothetical protein
MKVAGKYEKYIIEYDPSMEKKILPAQGSAKLGFQFPFTNIMYLDDSFAKGCHMYWFLWITPDKPFPFDIGHPPHIHKDGELLLHIGSDPYNPTDLGAECELYLGEELERYVINKTCAVWIPPGFIHSPWKPLEVRRPFMFIEINQGPVHTEKGFHHLIPEEIQKKYPEEMKTMGQIFVDEGY